MPGLSRRPPRRPSRFFSLWDGGGWGDPEGPDTQALEMTRKKMNYSWLLGDFRSEKKSQIQDTD